MNTLRHTLVLALIPWVVHATDIHQWRDKDGRIHFGDRPPVDAETVLITVKPNVYESPNVEGLSEILGQDDKVVMYSASWCGYCKKARSYFATNGIAYTEYDVENSAKGKRDYKKLGAKGVPVILVGDKRLNGFSEASFKSIYKLK